jgi:hypothetical protein
MQLSPFSKKIVIGFIFLALIIYLFIESSNISDFYIFLEASKSLIKAGNIFQETYFDGFHYFYSVMFALLIYPLTFIPTHLTMFLWLGFNVWLLYRLYHIVNFYLPLHTLSQKQKKIFWLLALVFCSRLILENLHLAQMTIFLLYISLEGIYSIQHKKIIQGAFLIALGINIKLLPIVLLPYLIYRKQFKPSLLIILFCFIFTFIPALIIGYEQNNLLLKTWLQLINPLNSNHILDVAERSFHGLSTLLSTLFVENVPDKYALKLKRNIANVSFTQLSYILNITRLLLILFTFYFLRTLPFKSITNKYKYRQFWELSYILLLIPLIFPHQQSYAFLFICPAYLCCLYQLIHQKPPVLTLKYYALFSIMAIVYLVANLKLILGEFNPYYEHYKILTYGALLLIIPLTILGPKSELDIITT